jgi:hypothetical protein
MCTVFSLPKELWIDEVCTFLINAQTQALRRTCSIFTEMIRAPYPPVWLTDEMRHNHPLLELSLASPRWNPANGDASWFDPPIVTSDVIVTYNDGRLVFSAPIGSPAFYPFFVGSKEGFDQHGVFGQQFRGARGMILFASDKIEECEYATTSLWCIFQIMGHPGLVVVSSIPQTRKMGIALISYIPGAYNDMIYDFGLVKK